MAGISFENSNLSAGTIPERFRKIEISFGTISDGVFEFRKDFDRAFRKEGRIRFKDKVENTPNRVFELGLDSNNRGFSPNRDCNTSL